MAANRVEQIESTMPNLNYFYGEMFFIFAKNVYICNVVACAAAS